MSTEPAELRRALGWPSIAAYGLGAILGAGIYSVIGAAAGEVGASMWLAFLISAVVAMVTAFAYAELATMFPRAGGEFLYVHHALPKAGSVSFTVGTMMVVSAAATAATVAVAFSGYLSALVEVPGVAAAIALVVVLALVAIVGVRESTWMVAAFTMIEAAGLIIVVYLGATDERFGEALVSVPTPNVLAGAALVFFSYLGFENIVNLAEETRRPERDLPRAIIVSLVVATALYILVALAVVALTPPAELARSGEPLAHAVRARSPSLAGALGGIALFATANTAMAALVSGSRILYAMAGAGKMPAVFARVARKRRTPWVATLVVMAGGLALLPLGRIAVIAGLSSFVSLLAFGTVNLALVILRKRDPQRRRPFRVPGAIRGVPVLPVVGMVLAFGLVTQLETRVIATGALIVAGALVLHFVGHRVRRAGLATTRSVPAK